MCKVNNATVIFLNVIRFSPKLRSVSSEVNENWRSIMTRNLNTDSTWLAHIPFQGQQDHLDYSYEV